MQKQQRLFHLSLLLCLVVVVSLAFNALLFRQARHYYLLLNKTNLDPLGLGTFSAESLPDGVSAASTATVVFFGDSRAEMWPAPATLKGFSFINRGIGSQTSAQILGRFDNHVVPLQPNIIIVQVGINDLKTIPLFPEQKAAIINNCKANIQQIVARSVNSGSTVILTTIFPIGPVPLTRQPFWSPDIAQAVSEVNAYLYSLKAKDVLILDAYSLLAQNGQVQSNYVRDTLHLNERGYKALNQELTHVLSTWLTDKSLKKKS
ncbi:SGNH/GDSL hydrolase family protein [Trichocoleus sp. FACHB-69]|uniref:SGNH/GDSL hydrolase family protein n=1 Tax=Trichocoleus sp. FACHB-69 TaxID=2692874 RepID=UPI001681CFE2|nr:GDSL-type esterase/lipase family protein [Trichocoleus sp. FACHB-69]MBD1933120.1 SGNH/GDSL hydrolase family protein [Trichocoleus sp. FACHB-69]